jgi:hypothetical protein
MNLSELEESAGQLLAAKRKLRNIEGELSQVQRDLKEQPRRSEKDKRFYSLIGLDWEEPSKLIDREKKLTHAKNEAETVIDQATDTILKGLLSEELVVPLEPNPEVEDRHFLFKFRYNATYPDTVEEISELLGLPNPLKIDSVVIWADKIEVTEVDVYYAKMKIVEAFDKIRKTISMKLAPRQQ